MYVTIMDLPLFKGIGKEHVSNFLEKTDLEFAKFRTGEKLYAAGDPCTQLKYIISGKVRFDHSLFANKCTLSEVLGAGTVIGADRLFGMNTSYQNTATAENDVSIMTFSKEKYLNLLQSDEIYLFNYLNYLSLKAQRSADSVSSLFTGTLTGNMSFWLSADSEPSAEKIEFHVRTEDIPKITNIPEDKVISELIYLQNKGLINYSDNIIRILSRERLLEEAEKIINRQRRKS